MPDLSTGRIVVKVQFDPWTAADGTDICEVQRPFFIAGTSQRPSDARLTMIESQLNAAGYSAISDEDIVRARDTYVEPN